MTDKVDKFLSKLSTKELEFVEHIFSELKNGNHASLNIKKLKGQTNIFRIKKGQFRVIFKMNGSAIELIDIGRRNEKTYRDF